MPTEEEERNVAAQVGRLERMKFTDRDGMAVPVFQGEPPKDALSWDELTPDRKETTLAMQVNWEGFTHAQELSAIGNVVEGKGETHWMDGIEVDRPGREAGDREAREETRAEPSPLAPAMEAAGNSKLPESIRAMEFDYHKMLEFAANQGKRPEPDHDKGVER